MNRILLLMLILLNAILFGCGKTEIKRYINFSIENQTDESIYVGVCETVSGFELNSHFVFEYADPEIFLKRIAPGDTIISRYVSRDYDNKIISIIAYRDSTLRNIATDDIVENNRYDWLFNYSVFDIKNMSYKIICN